MKRVVVTGLGLISALGIGLEESWKKLIAGETGIDLIKSYDTTDQPVRIAGEVKGFEPTDYGIEKKEVKKLARNTQFALVATKMALEDANFKIDETNADDVGVIVSAGVGGIEIMEEQYGNMLTKGYRRISPFTIPAMIENMAAGNIAIYYGAKGPNRSIVTACASGTHSIGDGFDLIRHGRAKAMIVGGTEASVTQFCINSFANMKALSTRNETPKTASRPFSKDRDGFVMGEGAGILILEELESALARGAKIYAEMVGFGDKAKDLYISSTKGATGHALGGAGGIEGVIIAKTIAEGIIPPTINLYETEEECDLNYVPNKAIKTDVKVAMSNSLGFGGHNSVIVMKKFEK